MIRIDTVIPKRSATLPVPVGSWLVVAVLVVVLLAMLQGQVTVLHEFVHDARHFIGVPCH